MEFEALAAEWRALAISAGPGIFGTWEWSEAWWRAFGEGLELALHAVRDGDGRLVAVLPLCIERRAGVRVVRFVGHGPGDELGPVHRASDRKAVAQALARALGSLRWDVAALEQLPGAVGWPRLLGEDLWRREANPVLQVPDRGWDAFLERRSGNFRQQLRRRERALEDAGLLRYRLSNRESLDRDLDTLFDLHRARWRGRATDFSDTPFHRDVARRAAEQGWLRLWLLELDDRVVAAWHGFRVGDVTTYYQAGRDPALDRLSPGWVLLAHSIREAMNEGTSEYRFGRGDDAFKYRFADHDPGLETVVLARGARGRGTRLAARVARSLRRGRAADRASPAEDRLHDRQEAP